MLSDINLALESIMTALKRIEEKCESSMTDETVRLICLEIVGSQKLGVPGNTNSLIMQAKVLERFVNEGKVPE